MLLNIKPNTINIWLNVPNIPLISVGENYFMYNGHIELYNPTHIPWINLPIIIVGNWVIWTKIPPNKEIIQTINKEDLKLLVE